MAKQSLTLEPISPLLNWPGGKRSLIDQLVPLLPQDFRNYYEPFFGGGALFFALRPAKAIISDTNPWLMECYQQVRDNPDAVWSSLNRLRNSEHEYYRVRSSKPRTPHGRAAKLIYLVNLSFNGIYRENLQGEFNVPYGRKTWKCPATWAQIQAASAALASATIESDDFGQATRTARAGDFVYFDPPYVTSNSPGFSQYNAKLFNWDDQCRLAEHACRLAERGVFVVVSNCHEQEIATLYPNFQKIVIHRHSRIAASATYRQPISEFVLVSGR